VIVQTAQDDRLKPGDGIDVRGFAVPTDQGPVLRDAVFEKMGNGPWPRAVPVSAHEALGGTYEKQLISVEGVLVSRVVQSAEQLLMMRAGDTLFNAALEVAGAGDPLEAIRSDSVVRLTGVCTVRRAGFGLVPESMQLLLRSPADIEVLRAASWWTRDR